MWCCLFVVVCLLFREVKIATLIFSCNKSNFVTGKAFLFLSESSGTSLCMCVCNSGGGGGGGGGKVEWSTI